MSEINLKKIIYCAVILAFISCAMIPSVSFADDIELGQVVDNNGRIRFEYSDDSVLGGTSLRGISGLPKKYSLVEERCSTSVKKQGIYSTCWAFGALASLESNLIKKGMADNSVDLSERHLVWFTYKGISPLKYGKSAYAGKDTFIANGGNPYDLGGARFMSAPTLERGYGAVKESIAPYSTNNMKKLSSSMKTRTDYRVGDIYYLPEVNTVSGKTNVSAIAAVKKSIIKYGALSTGYFSGGGDLSTYYNKKTYAYYSTKNKLSSDHEITIVGWDDTFSRDKFGGTAGKVPPKDGAWIIKNSWGTSYQNSGYFYLSYYDKSYGEITCFTAENKKNRYSAVYQYDGTGYGDDILISTRPVKGANRYTAGRDELIKALRVEIPVANTRVKVDIYINSNSTKKVSGLKVYSGSKEFNMAGYNTLKLGKTVTVPKGAKFIVAITEKYKDRNGRTRYVIPFEAMDLNKTGFVSLAPVKKGESFVYRSGKWYDTSCAQNRKKVFIKWYKPGNAVGKTLTSKCGRKKQKLYLGVKSRITNIYGKSRKQFNLKAKSTVGTKKIIYRSTNPKVAKVSKSGKVTVRGIGKSRLVATTMPDRKYASVCKVVKLTVREKK